MTGTAAGTAIHTMLHAAAGALFVAAALFATPSFAGWKQARFEAAGLDALVFDPSPQNTNARPLIVWLHGASLAGGEAGRVRQYGLPEIVERLPQKDFVLVAPHLSGGTVFWDPQRVLAVIDAVRAQKKIDSARIYLTGGSLGAAGVWATAATRPGAFAGIIAIASPGVQKLIDLAPAIGPVNAWMFHGERDFIVPISQGEAMAAALRKAGAQVRWTAVPEAGHDPMTEEVFVRSGALPWLLSQRLDPSKPGIAGGTAPLPLPAAGPMKDAITAWTAALTQWPHRIPGSKEGQAAEDWLEAEFRRLAPEAQIGRDVLQVERFNPTASRLTIGGRQVNAAFVPFSGFTPAEGLNAPLVYGGNGGKTDLLFTSAEGKIIVADGRFEKFFSKEKPSGAYHVSDPLDHMARGTYALRYPSNMLGDLAPKSGAIGALIKAIDAQENAKASGALGLIVLLEGSCSPYASQYVPYDGKTKRFPALYVSAQDSGWVREAARRGESASFLLTGSSAPAPTHNIWAVLPGRSDDVLLITSHHDSPHEGAVEDASGIAQVLAQLKRWAAVPKEQRPMTMIFVAAAAHFVKGVGAWTFAERHPDWVRKARGLITIEHVAAREVKPNGSKFELTGMPQGSAIFIDGKASADRVIEALNKAPQPSLSVLKPPSGRPLSDAGGRVYWAQLKSIKLPFASWISAPCYLVDETDTKAMLDPERYEPTFATTSAIVDAFLKP